MKLRTRLILSIATLAILFAGPVAAQPEVLSPTCIVPDSGGTASLPPVGCGYVSPDDLHLIIDGLPAGTTIQVAPEHFEFFGIGQFPGGNLGGEVEQFQSGVQLNMVGTGDLAGFARSIFLPAAAEVHTGPRNPGDPVQTFPNDMFSLQGEIFGDPDFDLLRIRAGTNFGLPSPGETTLTQLPGGNWNVDSFFDITYTIEFQGAPGSVLAGQSGITTDSVRMDTGQPPLATGPCVVAPNAAGVVELPPTGPGCPDGYISPDDFHVILDGLPAGQEIVIAPQHHRFINITTVPGGNLGGEVETFDSSVALHMTGIGGLVFDKTVNVPLQVETHTGPQSPGGMVQDFDNEMVQLQGEIFGDPDFAELRVRAGSGTPTDPGPGPSPGHTTLTQLPNGNFNVDSFFDITYQIDFVGAPGGALDGLSGTTTGQVRMGAGGPPGTFCPPIPPGSDIFPSTAKMVVQMFASSAPVVVRLSTTHLPDTIVQRGNQVGDTIPVEILSMDLSGHHPELGGDVSVQLNPARRSLGQLTDVLQDPLTCELISADSFFDVEVVVDLPGLGLSLEPDRPLRLQSKLHALPPKDIQYENPFVDPVVLVDPSDGTGYGEVVYHLHHVDPPFPPPGPDCFDTQMQAVLNLPAFGLIPVAAEGPTTVLKSGPSTSGSCAFSGAPCTVDFDCPIPGDFCLAGRTVQTEMLSMDLSGSDAVLGDFAIRRQSVRSSVGDVTSQQPDRTYPASSFFDVFFEVEVQGQVLHNEQPALVVSNIGSSGQDGVRQLPPDPDTVYQTGFHCSNDPALSCDPGGPPPGQQCGLPSAVCLPDEIPLLFPDGSPAGSMREIQHFVGPPRDWQPPPPADHYCFDSWVHLEITIFNPFCQETVWLPGIFRILRGDPTDPAGVGQEIMNTLMAKGLFNGNSQCVGPLTARLRRDTASSGQVSSLAPAEFYPADSFFDISVELDTGIGVLNTGTSTAHMTTTINSLPPEDGEIYFGPGTVIPLYDDTGAQIGEILEVSHEIHRRVVCPAGCYPRIRWRPADGPLEAIDSFEIGIEGGGGGLLYDVVRGDVSTLRAAAGGLGGETCLQDDGPAIVTDATVPASGDQFYYIAREVFDSFTGSWNSFGAGQAADRDPQVAPCP